MEGVHPQFNQPVKRFGNTRGGHRQQLVMNDFFSHATWVRETIDEMINETKTKKKEKTSTGLTSDQGRSVAEPGRTVASTVPAAAAPTGVAPIN